jgi:hypothetical protein
MTKPISTKVHGMADYSTAGLLLSAPFIFGYELDSAEALVPMGLGGMTTVASLCTDYEMGVVPMIDMKTHIALDVMNGLFLAASPFIFGFSRKGVKNWLPHVLIGLGECAVALMTDTSKTTTGQPAPSIEGRTQLEGYQPRGSRRTTPSMQGAH